MKRLMAAMAIVLVLGVCNDDDKKSQPTPTSVPDDRNDRWNRHYLPDGSYVNCLTSDSFADQSAIRGMSCDWVEYHDRMDDLGPQ